MSGQAKIWAVIPAAGLGTRMETDVPKQYLKISGKCILEYSIEKFCLNDRIAGVVVALSAGDPYWPTLEVKSHDKVMETDGGVERCHSVLNALRYLAGIAAEHDWVLVHDAARPCVHPADIGRLINTVEAGARGGLLAVPVRDTMKRVDEANKVSETVDRSGLWHALTPQMFRLGELTMAIDTALRNKVLVTDDAQAMERIGIQPLIVEGRNDNIKVTRPGDLQLAGLYISQQED